MNMTREEAIQIFLDRGWIKLENGTYFDGNKWREATMVISDYFRNEYKALEQEPQWIPVSERLPENDGRYLAYIINPYDDKLRYSMTCEYFTSEGWCPDDECASDNVVAWMPLPKPYKPESEDKE